jgi:hypothetical protein
VKAWRDAGTALALLLVLGLFWSAVEPRELESRLAAMVDTEQMEMPSLVIADWQGPGLASASCDHWRITIRPGAVATLSERALDDLLAHELAHLMVCAEHGRGIGHGSEWWQVYNDLRARHVS